MATGSGGPGTIFGELCHEMTRTNIQIAARLAIARNGAPAVVASKRSASVARGTLRPELLDIPGVRIKMASLFPMGRLSGQLTNILAEGAPDRHDVDQIGDDCPGYRQ